MKNDLQKMNICGEVDFFTETTYNIFSNEEETDFETDEEPSLIAEFNVNAYGNIAGQKIIIPGNSGAIETEYVYNDDNLKTEEIWHNPDGRVEKAVSEYDENGLVVREVSFRDGTEIVKSNFFYDEKLQLAEIDSIYTNGIRSKQIFKYDEAGRKTEELVQTKVEFTSEEKTTYAYNDRGDVAESTAYEPDGSVQMTTQYSYEYDHNGNWVSKIEMMDEMPMRKVVRELRYR